MPPFTAALSSLSLFFVLIIFLILLAMPQIQRSAVHAAPKNPLSGVPKLVIIPGLPFSVYEI